MGQHVMITGATGMIGTLVLQRCLESSRVEKVTSLVRRPSGAEHEKLNDVLVPDFLTLDENADCYEGVDTVFYCLGVYTGAVDRDLFRQITVDYPQVLANLLLSKGTGIRFCLLSGAGADRNEKSRMMFAKDKGAIENRLSRMGFKGFHAFRPGYIYPANARKEPNLSYKLTRFLYPVIKLMGSGYSIKSTELAAAMFHVGINGCKTEVLENKDILEIFKQSIGTAT